MPKLTIPVALLSLGLFTVPALADDAAAPVTAKATLINTDGEEAMWGLFPVAMGF